MISPSLLQELYDYNYWARDRQLEACQALTEEQFVRPMGNSFPSVRETLAHLVGAEWVWLQRWHGRSPQKGDPDLRDFRPENFPTVDEVRQRWAAVEKDVRQYLASLTDEVLEGPLTYQNLQGQTWTYPTWRTLVHLVNHQTYHRGQITTLLRQLGVPAIGIDFLLAQDQGLR